MDETRGFIFPLEEGRVMFVCPAFLTPESLEAVEELVKLTLQLLHRRVVFREADYVI